MAKVKRGKINNPIEIKYNILKNLIFSILLGKLFKNLNEFLFC